MSFLPLERQRLREFPAASESTGEEPLPTMNLPVYIWSEGVSVGSSYGR
jgi:hypothetical protein